MRMAFIWQLDSSKLVVLYCSEKKRGLLWFDSIHLKLDIKKDINMSDKVCLKGSFSLCCGDLGLLGLVETSTLQTSKIRWDESHFVMLWKTHEEQPRYFAVQITLSSRLNLKKNQTTIHFLETEIWFAECLWNSGN